MWKKLFEKSSPSPPPKATAEIGAGEHPILRDRLVEDMLLEGALPDAPKIPDNLISTVTIGFNSDKNFVCLFETKEGYRYGIVVELENHLSLGWKECQALKDTMSLAERGTPADNNQFKGWYQKLKNKYADCALVAQNSRLLMAITPGKGRARFDTNSIRSNRFDFEENRATFQLETSKNQFEISVVLLSPHQGVGLGIMECQVMADLFYLTETGDSMSEDTFMALCVKLVGKFNVVKVNESRRGFLVEVLPTRLEDQRIISPLIVDWLDKQGALSSGGSGSGSSKGLPVYEGFEAESMLVESGQATVYRGKKKSTGEKVAIKVYKGAQDLEEYTTELKALSKVGDHPNVVNLMGYFEKPKPCIVMKFIDGKNLRDFLKANGAVPERRAIRMALGIAKGLAHLHAEGFVHRDVKSLNVMISADDESPILIDMGLGKDVGKAETSQTVYLHSEDVKGTILWMSPEMMTGGEYSVYSDVFAFGVMLWEILSGRMPYDDFRGTVPVGLMQAIQNPINPLRPTLKFIPSSIPSFLVKLTEACWHPDTKTRPRMREVVTALTTTQYPPQQSINFKKKKLIEHHFRCLDERRVGSLSEKQFILFVVEVEPGTSIAGAKALFGLIYGGTSLRDNRLTLGPILEFWKELEEKGIAVADKIRMISNFEGSGMVARDPRSGWSVEDVVSRLVAMGLGEYEATFRRERVDGPALIGFTYDHLKRLGVISEVHRIRIRKMHRDQEPQFKNYLEKFERYKELKDKVERKEEEEKRKKEREKKEKEEVSLQKQKLERKIAELEEQRRLKKMREMEERLAEIQRNRAQPQPPPSSSKKEKIIILQKKLDLVQQSSIPSEEKSKLLAEVMAEMSLLA